MTQKLTSRDIYAYYIERGGALSWDQWRAVISAFNVRAMDAIIQDGKELELGNGLSKLSVIKIDRNHAAPRVDWPETKKLKQELLDAGETLMSDEHPEGIPYLVYYTDDWYCRFFWEKRTCKIRNKSAYRFDVSRGFKGNKQKLIDRLNSDDLAHLAYDRVTK